MRLLDRLTHLLIVFSHASLRPMMASVSVFFPVIDSFLAPVRSPSDGSSSGFSLSNVLTHNLLTCSSRPQDALLLHQPLNQIFLMLNFDRPVATPEVSLASVPAVCPRSVPYFAGQHHM